MLAVLETMPGLSRLVQEELKIRNISHSIVYREDHCLYIDVTPDTAPLLRKLQTVNYVEVQLFEVDYTRDVKTLRQELRKKFREIRDFIREGSLVTFRFYEISRRLQRVILREAERVLKCKLVKARGDYVLSARFLFRRIRIFLDIGTFQPLYRRWYTRYKSRASLHPVLAAALCLLAGPGDFVIDPFAGSYTIPIEYCRMWNPRKFTCIDISYEFLSKGKANLGAAGEHIQERVDVLCGDFFRISVRDRYDRIVTDPPRGLRLELTEDFYSRMFSKFREICTDDVVIAMPVFKRTYNAFLRTCEKHGFKLVDSIETVQGGYRTLLVKLKLVH